MVIDDQPGGWEMLGWYLAGLGSCQVWSSQSGGGHWEFPRNSREFPDSRFPWNSLGTPLVIPTRGTKMPNAAGDKIFVPLVRV